MTAEDRKPLLGYIAARYGMRIDENDPAFVVANLSQHALREASAELLKRMGTLFKDFEGTVVGISGQSAGNSECHPKSTAGRHFGRRNKS